MIRLPKKISELKNKKSHFFWIGTGVIGVISIDFSYSLILELLVHNPVNRSSFGDYHNAINTLFTGLALVFVVYGVYVQHEENKKRDAEKKIEDTELREERMKTEKHRLQDNFEERLFNMLHDFQTIVSDLKITFHNTNEKKWKDAKGRAVFLEIGAEIVNESRSRVIQEHDEVKFEFNLNSTLAYTAYKKVYDTNEHNLGIYFRTLYQIFKFIDKSEHLTETEKLEYAHLVRARLSNYEAFILLINSMFGEGVNFEKYIEKYSLAKHLPTPVKIINKKSYTAKAFNENASTQQ